MFQQNQQVEIWFPKHDGTQDFEWTAGRVMAVRETDYSVKPGCVRVYLPGASRGRYDLPLERVRAKGISCEST